MTLSSRRVYLLAKMYGRVAHSYLGENLRDLLRLKSLAELQAALWPGPGAEGAAPPTADEIEHRVTGGAASALRRVLTSLGNPEPILVHLLRRLELKTFAACLRAMERGAQGPLPVTDLGPWATLVVRDARDAEKALLASPYAWAVTALRTTPRVRVENEADCRWFAELLRLARALPAPGRNGVLPYVQREIASANVVWALRLRFTYGMDAAAARPLLVPGMGDSSRRALMQAFEIAPDATEDWKRWRFGWVLADQLADQLRAPDPVAAEARVSQDLFVRARHLLHQHPFSVCPFVGYFALKLHEASMLRTASEAVALGLPEKEALALAGLQERVAGMAS